MDVENLVVTAPENLSVRRAFGTAYEKDGMLIIPVAMLAEEAAGARHSTAGLRAQGRRRGLRQAGAAIRCLRREGRPGPLGTRSGRGDRRPGFAEPGAGAGPHLDPPAQAPRPAMTLRHSQVEALGSLRQLGGRWRWPGCGPRH